MNIFRNLSFWFIALLVVLVVGFWETYFSVLFQDMHPSHHFHGITMLLWVLLLISQAWLIRTRRMSLHRLAGRLSLVLAPLIVISGVIVTYHNIGNAEDPTAPFMLSLFWLGLFSSALFGLLYLLAMIYRSDFQLHARYMIGTALVFVVPGLSRTFANFVGPLGLPSPDFYGTQVLVGVMGVALVGWDRYHGRFRLPFMVFTALWMLNLIAWHLIPKWPAWQSFTAWSHAFAS